MKHLFLDVRAQRRPLGDVEFIRALLNRLVVLIGMTKLDEPKMYEVSDGEDSGITGWCPIKESHISIHTWPEKGKAYIDVFSCLEFDCGKVEKFVGSWLHPFYMKITEVKRMNL